MLASVVVVNHNYGRFVADAIDSALAQTHRPLEVVVVDDGSTDASRSIIASYGPRIKPVLQGNRGQGGAFNAGFAASSGELVVFLDSDDMLLPDAVELAADGLDRHPGAAEVHWKARVVDADGTPTGEVNPVAPLAHGDLLPELLADGPLQWSSPGAAWPRPVLDQMLPMPEPDFRIGADAYLVALTPLYGTVVALDEPQSLYRRHGGGHSQSGYDEVLRFDVDVARKLVDIVGRRAAERGLECDSEQWLERGWSFKLQRALTEIDALIGTEVPFVLVDDQELALDTTSGRAVLPFLERDGEYWGRPADDAEAIRELERMRRAGAEFLVLAWPAFWWQDVYTGFIAHLRRTYSCRLASELLVVFDLREGASEVGVGA